MPFEGCATLDGTARYRERFKEVAAENHFRSARNLWLSSIGVGTYLGEADDETDARYAEAIVRAVELGSNVIDTAANYRFQRSERAIGAALTELSQRGFARDEIVVCTKGGYLPFDGAPPRDVRQYIEETFVKPGIASFADIVGGAHCMTPRYLLNQLDQSLANMGLDCVDVYYVHNPESQLSAISQEEFWQRLRAAFEFLEQRVVDGKIRNYGVATWNGFRAEPDSREYHSLSGMVEVAREVGGDEHHFRFIQLPVNLAMPEALFFQNQQLGDEYVNVLEAAENLEVTAIASGSILQGQVSRGLPEAIREPLGSLATDAQTGIQFVRSAPGITTALVGMSQRAHVEENLQLARIEPAQPDDLISVF
ncbi:MAG TPA: aldo/keto reductase, partial [Pyrinomonadaceae bacterium]|nr:aldo/keto reductase [Pyrinomonadaceae bacterium]